MNVQVKGMEHLSQIEKNRINLFHEFIFQSMIKQKNMIYFKQFLESQFTTFPLGKGYPLIPIKCQSASCYFYINLQQTKSFDHNFLKFLNEEIPVLKCRCGQIYRHRNDFIYDMALEGLFQFKISQESFRYCKVIKITKNHEIWLDKHDIFSSSFNQTRLKNISAKLQQLSLVKKSSDQNLIENNLIKQESTQPNQKSIGNTLQIKTYSLLKSLQQKIFANPTFVPKQSSLQLKQSQNKINPQILICPSWNQKRGLLYLHKQIKQQHIDNKIKLQFSKDLPQKIIYYYEQATLTLFGLAIDGSLYKCDFKSMYNMINNSYSFIKFGSLAKLLQMENMRIDNIKFVVVKNIIYVFIMKQAERYIDLFKGDLKSMMDESDPRIEVNQILINKINSRKGYNISFVNAQQLIKQACILIFGGTIQKVKNYKILQIIVLKNQGQVHNMYKINVSQDNFRKISLTNPSFTFFQQHLVLWGGADQRYNPPKNNNSIIFISMGQKQTKVYSTEITHKQQKIGIKHDINHSIAVNNNRNLIISSRDMHKNGQIHVLSIRRVQSQWEVQCSKKYFT